MKKILIALWALAFFLFFISQCQIKAAEITPEFLEQKSKDAREILEKETVHYYVDESGKITSREILLAAYSPFRDKIELVRLEVIVDPPRKKEIRQCIKWRNKKCIKTKVASQKKEEPSFIFSVLTPHYKVERIRGFGVIRLDFSVERNEEELIFLDGRHLITATRRGEVYFPFSNIYISDYGKIKGGRFLRDRIREAQRELCTFRVTSRAYPTKALCEVFNEKLIFNLAFIEQTDDKEFIDDPEYAFNKFLTHIWRNAGRAFGLSLSSAKASGLMQFMNTPRVPTYKKIVEKYPDAKLNENYKEGTADMVNSIKAAICLLDHDLARFPGRVRDDFEANQRLGGLTSIASYNGGPENALRLYKAISGKEIDRENFKLPAGTLVQETIGYIAKYLAAWDMLDRLYIEIDKADAKEKELEQTEERFIDREEQPD
ncbi:lytic transglycosylase domain-containing protein [Candidatus Giovannonibacteria bacterium]|nr:lytic transglycosylase domain-containing protein [Candidatus Giovannonibacteria bacterium]